MAAENVVLPSQEKKKKNFWLTMYSTDSIFILLLYLTS